MNDLATQTKAICWTPMYQCLRATNESWAHPTFFLFFAYYRNISVPQHDAEVSDAVWLGDDIWDDMLRMEAMPCWEANDHGNGLLQNLGHIKMKPQDFSRWCDGCFQTCIWLGTPTPSKKSQQNTLARPRAKVQQKAKTNDK